MSEFDFVDSIKIQLADIESIGELGFVNGISKLIINNLKALDESEFDRYCKVKAKNLSQKSDLLRKFFGKNNVEVWDIYQLEKNFDNLENNKINEVDKIIETGKSNDLNQDVKEFLDENEKIN